MELEKFVGQDLTTPLWGKTSQDDGEGWLSPLKFLELTALCLITRLLGQVTPCSRGTEVTLLISSALQDLLPRASHSPVSSSLCRSVVSDPQHSPCVTAFRAQVMRIFKRRVP